MLDQLLRNRESLIEHIFTGKELGTNLRWFLTATLLLSGLYGFTMGLMGFTHTFTQGIQQGLTSAVKVPLLFLLSIGVCFPVLYVALVLMGVRLRFAQTLALILMATALNAVLLASCAPMVFFFVVTGSDYDFIKLLHVAIFAFSGGWAMMALWQGLAAMCDQSNLYPKRAVQILKVWILVFGFVGTQMAWSLRPFVGSPSLEFQVFRRGQSGNFYTAVWSSMVGLSQGTREKVSNPD